jgi:hypothetical protein
MKEDTSHIMRMTMIVMMMMLMRVRVGMRMGVMRMMCKNVSVMREAV